MNELLFIATIFVYFSLMLLFYRLWGPTGLFVWCALASVIANIEALKLVPMFGMQATLGNVIYGSNFLATDILSENHSKKLAHKTIAIGFAAILAFTVATQMTLAFIPAADDFVQGSMQTIFSITPRISLASITTYLVSQNLDILLYHLIWRKTGDRFLFLRNNIATLICQLLDTALFTILAFWGLFPPSVVVELIFSTYLLKILVSLLDTPFLYLARRMRDKVPTGFLS